MNEISMKVFIQLPSFILLQLRCSRSRRDVGIMSYRMTLVEPELRRIPELETSETPTRIKISELF
jgi:hypothetical protein